LPAGDVGRSAFTRSELEGFQNAAYHVKSSCCLSHIAGEHVGRISRARLCSTGGMG
jgi:hypothetical protein